MKSKRLGVGIIGASEGGWAVKSHLPALMKLKDTFEVVAVSTTNTVSAKKTAEKFNVANAFDNESDLVNHPGVDLVVVAVRVPLHLHLVKVALEAGKMVYCEWPLGNGTDEAERLLQLAEKNRIRTFTGLQARSLPEIRYLKDLLEAGRLGQIFSVTVVGTGNDWGVELPVENMAYLCDPKNGATIMSVPFAHAIDSLIYCLGGMSSLSGLHARRNKETLIQSTSRKIPQLTNDEVLMFGELISGTVLSVHYRGGHSQGLNFYCVIRGEKGEIVISSPVGHLQFGKLNMQIALGNEEIQELRVPFEYRQTEGGLQGYDAELSYAMYYAYQAVAKDILHSTHVFPDFKQATNLHKLLDTFERACASGLREYVYVEK